MSDLIYKVETGENDYVVCAIGPKPAPGQETTRSPVLRILDLGDPFPKGGLKVTVPAGATQLAAALRGIEGDVPAGVIVTVTKPDGTVLDQPTEPWDPNLVVQITDNSLVGLLVRDPQQGDWTIQVDSANPDADYIFGFSTFPTKDVQQTVDQTLSKMLPAEAREHIEAELDDSWGCFSCKVACYALAVVITALVAAGLTYVTAGAAPIIALAA